MDFYSDNGALLKHKLQGWEIPDFVKNALVLDEEKRASLSDDHFAYVGPSGRYFPITDAGNTFASVVYFLEHGVPEEEMTQKVAHRLCNACVHFDIEPPEILVQLASFAPPPKEQEKTAISADDIMRVVDVFCTEFRTYDPETRRATAEDIVKAAAAVGIDPNTLPSEVLHYAGTAWNSRLPEHLTIRWHLLKEAGSNLAPVLNKFMELALVDDVDPVKFAYELYAFDKEAGLLHLYDDRLTDAFASTLSHMHPTQPNGVVEALQKFASSDHARQIFSDDLLRNLREDPEHALLAMPERLRDIVIEECANFLQGK